MERKGGLEGRFEFIHVTSLFSQDLSLEGSVCQGSSFHTHTGRLSGEFYSVFGLAVDDVSVSLEDSFEVFLGFLRRPVRFTKVPKAKATTVHDNVITLYGMLKSGKGIDTNRPRE